jgi:hypothetical protein
MIAAKNGHVLKSSKMASLLDGVKSVLISMRIVVVDNSISMKKGLYCFRVSYTKMKDIKKSESETFLV